MMPDLGRYAVEVGLAYAGSLALLAGLVAPSEGAVLLDGVAWVWWRGRRVRARLAAVEARRDGAKG